VRLSALGDFAIFESGTDLTPRPAKLRSILALLAIRNGESVSRDAIINEIWADSPPEHAAGAIHTYVYELRRSLGSAGQGRQILVTKPHGYSLDISGIDFDFNQFDEQARQGASLLANAKVTHSRTDLEEASRCYDKALSLWSGEPMANVACGDQLGSHVIWLVERRRQALEGRLQADTYLGRGPALVGELKVQVERDPFHEGFHELLMVALAQAGRRSEALDVFTQLRRQMSSEFGLEPGPALQRLQRALLVGDPDFGYGPGAARRTPDRVRRKVSSTQLPPDIPDFCGRADLVDGFRRYLTRPESAASPVVCVHGMTGVGKSALVVHVANELAPSFPDGVIYVDLHRAEARSRTAAALFTSVLRELGQADDELPDTVEECVGAIRSLSLGRRVLLVLDGASPHLPIAKLMPTGCATIVTSRWPLHGIAGAKRIKVPSMRADEAQDLLTRIVDDGGSRLDQDAARRIVDRVGTLPLGVRFVGERLVSSPTTSIEQVWSNIVSSAHMVRLSDLERMGFDLASRLDATFRDLDEVEREAFQALAPLRHAPFTTGIAAKALRCTLEQADIALISLEDAGLVEVVGFDGHGERVHALHELVGLYALECGERRRPAPAGRLPRRRPPGPRRRPFSSSVYVHKSN
jgi:DNA-binding SARP family transcriptional activator